MTTDATTKAAVNAETAKIMASATKINALVAATTVPPVIPPVIPPAAGYTLNVQAETMRLVQAKTMVVETIKPGITGTGSIGHWGSALEALDFDIEVLTTDSADDEFVLRVSNGGTAPARRQIEVRQGVISNKTAILTVPNVGAWDTPTWQDVSVKFALPIGKYTCRITCLADGEYLDLDAVTIKSTQQVKPGVPVVTVPPVLPPVDPSIPPGTVPPSTGTIWQVPAQGSLQTVANQARGGDRIEVSGIVADSGKILQIANRNNGPGKEIVVVGKPGHVLRGAQSGIEGFGSNKGWRFLNLNVEVNGGAYYGEGFYFAGGRTDFGGDGGGCSRITLLNSKFRAIAGTGNVQRHCVCVWEGDFIEFGFIDGADAGWNDNGFLGGAASGCSFGPSYADNAAGITSVHPTIANVRHWIHDSKFTNIKGPGSGSYDRNIFILDLFHTRANYAKGMCLIETINGSNAEGRGIELGWAGMADAQIYVRKNVIRAPMATNLAGSEPICGIGGYGAGQHGNILVEDNDVQVSPGIAAYKFLSFDAGYPAAVRGVRGARNKGGPCIFENSAPDGSSNVPAGFIS